MSSLTLYPATLTAKPFASSTISHQAFRYRKRTGQRKVVLDSRLWCYTRMISTINPQTPHLLSGTRAYKPREALHCQRLSSTLLPPRQWERAQGKITTPFNYVHHVCTQVYTQTFCPLHPALSLGTETASGSVGPQVDLLSWYFEHHRRVRHRHLERGITCIKRDQS